MEAGRAVGGCCDVMDENNCGPRMAQLRLGSRKGKVGGPSCDPWGNGGWPWWQRLVWQQPGCRCPGQVQTCTA